MSLLKTKLMMCVSLLSFIATTASAQVEQSTQNKEYSMHVGFGYFTPTLSDEGVSFPDSQYEPEFGIGFSYFISFDYALTKDFYIGVGYNGSYGKAKFIKNATINGEQINGYLEAGALENSYIVMNVTFAPEKEGIQPFAKLGLGYFISEVELGDVPLNLTNDVEFELFPDFKSSGFGILPELGIKYNQLALSVAYGIPFSKLTGENSEPGAYISTESVSSNSLQINLSYRIFLF